jgi:aminoglycoside phosphotransferase (APT) family kinase protein
MIDQTKSVRAGEELPKEALEKRLPEVLQDFDPPFEIEQFPSGHSNLTYLLRDKNGREAVLRRPPFGNRVKSAHDMGREARILQKLGPLRGRVPRVLHYEEDETTIGSPFYVMERVVGTIFRRKLPDGVALTPEAMRATSLAIVDEFIGLHSVDLPSAGLSDFGKPDGYVERQVKGWAKRYIDAKTDNIDAMESVGSWLESHIPSSPPATVLHNDFKFDNVVLDANDLTRVVAVLDWEMATIGDPLMDLGTTLAYWVEADDPEPLKAFSFGPTHHVGAPKRSEIAERYANARSISLEHLNFYFAFALFKNAVVAQQIYKRWKLGLTNDARFEMFLMGVELLANAAKREIDQT